TTRRIIRALAMSRRHRDIIYVKRYFFFQAEDGIRDRNVTGVQTCALPIWARRWRGRVRRTRGAPRARAHGTGRPRSVRSRRRARSEERRVGKEGRARGEPWA